MNFKEKKMVSQLIYGMSIFAVLFKANVLFFLFLFFFCFCLFTCLFAFCLFISLFVNLFCFATIFQQIIFISLNMLINCFKNLELIRIIFKWIQTDTNTHGSKWTWE